MLAGGCGKSAADRDPALPALSIDHELELPVAPQHFSFCILLVSCGRATVRWRSCFALQPHSTNETKQELRYLRANSAAPYHLAQEIPSRADSLKGDAHWQSDPALRCRSMIYDVSHPIESHTLTSRKLITVCTANYSRNQALRPVVQLLLFARLVTLPRSCSVTYSLRDVRINGCHSLACVLVYVFQYTALLAAIEA